MIDPELQKLHLEAQQANERLVARVESYGNLVPASPAEADIADNLVNDVLRVERQFRAWYERSRDVREMLEDPDLRDPGRS